MPNAASRPDYGHATKVRMENEGMVNNIDPTMPTSEKPTTKYA